MCRGVSDVDLIGGLCRVISAKFVRFDRGCGVRFAVGRLNTNGGGARPRVRNDADAFAFEVFFFTVHST